MTKQTYVRKALLKLKDVWFGAGGLLYFLETQQLDSTTIDTICVLLQEAIHPVYQHDAQTTQEITQTIQKLEKLKEHMQEEENLDAQLRVVDI